MATRKPREVKPEVYPEVDPELMDIVNNIYSRWTGDEFANAIKKYRREHDLNQRREQLKQQMAEIAQELEDEQ
jgi:hypothetical protein